MADFKIPYNEELNMYVSGLVYAAALREKVYASRIFAGERAQHVSAARRQVIYALRTRCLTHTIAIGRDGTRTLEFRLIQDGNGAHQAAEGFSPISFPQIAALLGLRNHTSALLAWRQAYQKVQEARRQRESEDAASRR